MGDIFEHSGNYAYGFQYQIDGNGDLVLFDDSGTEYSIAESADGDGNQDSTWTIGEDNGLGQTYYGHLADGTPVFTDGDTPPTFWIYSNDPVAPAADGSPLVVDQSDTPAFCFARGTLISTPQGATAVETLAIGDEVLNVAGNAVKVKWIGRQTRHPLIAAIHHDLPIRISAGSLGDGLPLRDLFVSPDHALLVMGCLVHAQALVNGRTIEQVKKWAGNVEYFHIETERHEIILAEGAAAETFVDNVGREKFDNYAEFVALYPHAEPMIELDLPRINYQRQLPRAISRVLDAVADELLGRLATAA